MAQLILPNGGVHGGLFVSKHGVRPLPPLNPELLHRLRGLSALLNGGRGTPPESVNELGTLLNRLSNLIFAEIEGIVGPLDGKNSLIYQSDEGGFYCGSDGKPPSPFSWPVHQAPSVQSLVATGLLERDLIDFLKAAVEQKIDIVEAFENPADAAAKLGVPLSEKSAFDLRRLAPTELLKIQDQGTRELVEFFYRVAEDGRFLETWITQPYAVAKELKVRLSEHAIDRLLSFGGGGAPAEFPWIVVVRIVAEVVVEVVEIVVLAARVAPDVNDLSGREKF